MTHPSDDAVRPDTSETSTDEPALSRHGAEEEGASAAAEAGTTASRQAAAAAVDVEDGDATELSEPSATPEEPAVASEDEQRKTKDGAADAASPAAADPAPEASASEVSPSALATEEVEEPSAADVHLAQIEGSEESAASDGQEAGGTEDEATASAPATPPVPSDKLEAFQALMEAFEQGKAVEGKVIGWNKGGFHVSLDGVPGFCPKSQIEVGNPKKSSSYVGRDLQFKIIEVRDGGKRIVISRAVMLKEEKERLLSEVVVPGKAVEGTVSNITDFGAFVDLGGIEGLVHLSKLSRRRVDHPRDLLQVGDRVKVKVLRVEKNGNRISLSMKDLEPDPWDSAAERYPIGSKLEGKILRAADFGLFVEVEPGLEGLVHTSQLPLGKDLDDPSLAAGTDATCWVRSVDGSRRRMSLAMREVATSDPWADLTDRYPEGTEVEGRVEQVARFGLFVELEPGLTGLLPYSMMSLPETTRPERTYSVGQPIAVQVSAIDLKRRRISLAPKGKQLEGTKADYKEYQQKQRQARKSTGGLNVMAAAFAKLEDEAGDRA